VPSQGPLPKTTLVERPDPDLAVFESGAGVGVAKSPEGHRWDSFPKARFAPDSPVEGAGFELSGEEFAPDSPLEGDGFEPSVPRPRRALLSGPLPPPSERQRLTR
jgi:hypothetical protein